MSPLPSDLVQYVRDAAATPQIREYLRETLLRLVNLNTAPDADLPATAVRERAFFDFLEEKIRAISGGMTMERAAIPSAIERDPDYSLPGYAVVPGRRNPTAEEIYAGRSNLY